MGEVAEMLPGDNIRISMDTCTEPFWQAAKEGRLTVCQCGDCGTYRMPPRPFCPECQSKNINWPDLSGKGTIYSYVVCHKSPFSGDNLTYVPIVVDLDDAPGARLVTNLVGIDSDEVEIGMKVQVDFYPITDGWMLPIFRPAL